MHMYLFSTDRCFQFYNEYKINNNPYKKNHLKLKYHTTIANEIQLVYNYYTITKCKSNHDVF